MFFLSINQLVNQVVRIASVVLSLCLRVNRKSLPELKSSIHAVNELDRYLRSCRETEMARIAADAAALRDTETSVDKALTKLERFLATLSNLAVEVIGNILHVLAL